MKQYISSLLLLGLVLCTGCANTSSTLGSSQTMNSSERQLLNTSENWLQLIDQEKYKEAFDQVAQVHKSEPSTNVHDNL